MFINKVIYFQKVFPVLVNCDAVSDDDSCEEFTSERDAVKGDCEI